jgi:uncharacterized protein with GYD domain
MATFIVLASFTDQGIHEVKETISRAGAFKEMAKKIGVGVKDIYWTLGSHDVVAICEAPDDESASALALSVGSRGKSGPRPSERSHSMRSRGFSARWFEATLCGFKYIRNDLPK